MEVFSKKRHLRSHLNGNKNEYNWKNNAVIVNTLQWSEVIIYQSSDILTQYNNNVKIYQAKIHWNKLIPQFTA